MDSSRFTKLAAVRNAPPTTQALLRKLNTDSTQANRSSGQTKSINLNRFMMEKLSNNTAQDILDSDSIMQLLPDLELAEQILVGSILSPKDMSTADISIVVAENQFEGQIASQLLEIPTRHFKHDYKIDERLDIQLENILTRTGSTILLVLPENNIDAIINGQTRLSMESFQTAINRMQAGKAMGFLGHPSTPGISMESYNGALDEAVKLRNLNGKPLEHVTITDNFNVLKQTDMKARMRSLRVTDRINAHVASMEDASQNMHQGFNLTTAQIDQLYSNRQVTSKAVEVITPQAYMNRPSVGHPLAMDIPPEAVIPVYTPGKPDEHVGYFILLDIFGRFVTKTSNRDYYGEMRAAFGKGNSKDNSSELLRITREAMGVTDHNSTFDLEQIQQTYATILENDLHNRLRNGLYDEELDIGFTEEVTRIMLYRRFKQQNTQMLYVPAELVSYIAFNYNKDGIGQTLLAKSKILSNMRSVLLFAETMGGVRNAVGRKKVNVTLDPDDPDKTDTVAKVQELIMETARNAFPIGAPDPAQSLDYLTRAGYDFSINAESEDYAQTKIEYDDYNTNIQAGNPELQDRLRRMQVSGLGVPPEKVDPTASPDFAVGVVQNDLIMTRRVKRYQKIFCRGQTKFVRTYTRNSSVLIQEMLETVKNNQDLLTDEQRKLPAPDLVRQFIDALEVRLPEPDTTRIDLMAQAFNQFNDLLDNALNAYITPELFPDDSFQGASGAAERFKGIIKAYFQRQYLAQNNVLPELGVLHEMDGDKPTFNLLDIQNHSQATLGSAMHQFLKHEQTLRDKWKKEFPPPADGTDGGDFGGDGGFGGSDTFGGSDDAQGFGEGDDTFGGASPPLDDAPTEEAAPAEETPPAEDAPAEADLDAAAGDETPPEAEEDNPPTRP